MLANAGMVFSLGVLLQSLAEDGVGDGTVRTLAMTFGVFTASAIARWICAVMGARMSHLSSVRVKEILREKIYRKLVSLGVGYTRRVRTSEVVQMAGEGVEQLEIYFGKYLPQLIYSLLAPVTLFALLAFADLMSAAALLACVPLILISVIAVSKIAKRRFTKYWGVYTDLGANFLENIQGLTTLKIYRADGRKHEEMKRDAELFRKITMKVLSMQLGSATVMDIVAFGGAAAGIIVAALQYMAGATGLAGCFAVVMLSAEFFIPMRLLGSYFHVAMNGMSACDRIFALLDLPDSGEKTRAIDENADRLEISTENLSFSYGGGETAYALRDINLRIPGRALVAVVGESGCGKSSLAKVLAGINEGYEGSVRVLTAAADTALGETELSEIRESDLMKHVALVGANSHIFKGTVRENLLIANRGAGDGDMWRALSLVKLDAFLRSENGLDTRIAENAANLSGGQRQRLALARALLHDASLYILDEATGNIDAESENLIMGVVRKLALTKSVLLISHRLANVTEAQCIYVFKDGRLAESGGHDELVAVGGVYAELYAKQKELEGFTARRPSENPTPASDIPQGKAVAYA
jgi:ABC-type transport system involved in cytochrome bd biosynthesis fused ATPase/permease subunit